MNIGQKFWILCGLTLTLCFLGSAIGTSSVRADTVLAALGDVGCKTVAKENLNNIGKADIPLLTVGDYLYKCSPSKIQKYWDAIRVKHGVYGNHDADTPTNKAFTIKNLGLGPKGWFSWRLGDIGIIGINQYAPYKIGTEQYNYVKDKTEQFITRPGINWIVYVFHEPIYTPTVEGGHGPNKLFRSVYEPIIKSVPNSLVIEAHNHVTAFGNIAGINQAICGGGGQGGDEVTNGQNGLNGWEWQMSDVFGYCLFEFHDDYATAKLIKTDGTTKETHTYTK